MKRVEGRRRREGTAAHTQRHGGEKVSRRHSTVREARPSTGQGGWKIHRILEGGGRGWLCHLVPCVPLNPRRSPGGMVGNLAPKAEKDGEEVSHKNVLQANSTGLLLWLGEREGENKRGHDSWSSWYGNFFKLKAWTEALHLITYKHTGEESVKTLFGYSSELKIACGIVPQRAQKKSEEYISTDHSLFFLSFELKSFLNEGCFHWGFQWCKLVQLAFFQDRSFSRWSAKNWWN